MNVNFIMAPAIVGIVFYSLYKVIELLVRRKERILMIEKIQDISSANDVNLNKIFGDVSSIGNFVALRFGAAFLGIGLGLLIGFIVDTSFVLNGASELVHRSTIATIYGASTLLFGGIALILCFIYEQKCRKNS